MQEYLGLLIGTARSRLKQAVLSCTTRHRLSAQQFWALWALRGNPGISQTELAERLRMDAPTTSRILTALVVRALVRVDLDQRDRRRSSLRLTGSGERLSRELAGTADQIQAALVKGMTQSEVERLRQGLKKIISNKERFEARASRRTTS